MPHFAQVDENNIVTRVLVIDQETVDTGLFGDPKTFIQTSYNTFNGVHLLGGTPLRKNYAGVGYKYDEERDAFIPPKPYNSWIFSEEKCNWEPPMPMPEDSNLYLWDEETVSWKLPEA
jgi:hypothetical protein